MRNRLKVIKEYSETKAALQATEIIMKADKASYERTKNEGYQRHVAEDEEIIRQLKQRIKDYEEELNRI